MPLKSAQCIFISWLQITVYYEVVEWNILRINLEVWGTVFSEWDQGVARKLGGSIETKHCSTNMVVFLYVLKIYRWNVFIEFNGPPKSSQWQQRFLLTCKLFFSVVPASGWKCILSLVHQWPHTEIQKLIAVCFPNVWRLSALSLCLILPFWK